MRVKICGITQTDQGVAIANLGATALGFICVPVSPRYVTPQHIQAIISQISSNIDFIGVFADTSLNNILETVTIGGLTGIQLHGKESPQFCQEIKEKLPNIELIKAFRVKNQETLANIPLYTPYIDTLLLDAYHPQQLGGTGKMIESELLSEFKSSLSWFLAGGLTPDNVRNAIAIFQPNGIDLSSGVERSQGDKDLEKVRSLFENLLI